ncbi:MAG: glycerol-3-phosphate dehydrogenase C-terminal domain-containing protein, partial [Burkholderia sp.]
NADNPSAVTRDYKLEMDNGQGAPLLSVFGGKITTFRKLAEDAADMLVGALGSGSAAWTAGQPLPGGDIASARFVPFAEAFAKRHAWLPAALARRYARAYGTRAERIVAGTTSPAGLGTEIAPGIYEAELRYLRDSEWATRADDVLWRRSKLGLHVAPGTLETVAAALDAWFAQSGQTAASAAEPAARDREQHTPPRRSRESQSCTEWR